MKRKFLDTMISAQDFPKLVNFYEKFWGLEVTQRHEMYAMLVDPETKQALCITNGQSVDQTSPGFDVEDIDKAVRDLEALGGTVVRRWELKGKKGANCRDPEGNEIMVWQGNFQA